jgi:protein-S-isoprenylcysteine O-methyltransferase Ste14
MKPLPFTDPVASVLFAAALLIMFAVQFRSGSGFLRRRTVAIVTHVDRGSLVVVIISTVLGVLGAAAGTSRAPWATIAPDLPLVRWVVFGIGIAAIVGGALFRLWAVVTLGQFFTLDVRISSDQKVVTAGPYRWVRHPSYTGLLLSLLGIGLCLGNWVSVLAIVVLPLIGLVRRIFVEEGVLLANLGEPYRAFAAGRKRLVPGVW